MEFVEATPKTLYDIEDKTVPLEMQTRQAFQITEENAQSLGETLMGVYYLIDEKVRFAILKDDFYNSDIALHLWSSTKMVRAEIGDWLLVRHEKYKVDLEWIGKDAFEVRFDVPQAPAEEVVDEEIVDPEAGVVSEA